MIIKYLNKLANKLQTIEYQLNVEKVRYANVNDECKKNIVISIMFLFLNASNIVLNNLLEQNFQIINSFVFVIMLILMCYSSKLWNFELCPEKNVIRKLVYFQIVIRFVMIASLFVILQQPEVYRVLVICMSISDLLLNVLIKLGCKNIVVEKNKSIFKDDITDWDIRNIDKIAGSVSYGGFLLYLFALTISMESEVLVALGIKICIFIGVICTVNNKIAGAYEDINIHKRKTRVINIFLLLGAIINCFGVLFEDNHIKDLFVMFGILCMFPLCNEYAAIGNKVKKIRYEQEINKSQANK